MKRHDFLSEPLDTSVKIALARLEGSDSVEKMAVMTDVHLAETVCIGVVLACRDRLLPKAFGGDIGCGVSTVPLDGPAALDADRAARILAVSRAGFRWIGGFLRWIMGYRSPEARFWSTC